MNKFMARPMYAGVIPSANTSFIYLRIVARHLPHAHGIPALLKETGGSILQLRILPKQQHAIALQPAAPPNLAQRDEWGFLLLKFMLLHI